MAPINIFRNRQRLRWSIGTDSKTHTADPSVCTVAVIGPTGSGKSSFVRSVTGRNDICVGDDLKSSTQEVRAYAYSWKGRKYELIDTPGFDDTYISDTDVLRKILTWMKNSYEAGHRIHGLVYLHRISDIRMQGSAQRNFHIFKQICGEQCLGNVVLATTFWDITDGMTACERETALTRPGGFWGDMIQKGSRAHRLNRSRDAYMELLESFAMKAHVVPQAQEELVMQSKSISQTLVGRFIHAKDARATRRQLSKLDKQHHQRLKAEVEAAAAEQAERDSRAFMAAQQRYGELSTRAEAYERRAQTQAEREKQEHEAEIARMESLAKEEQERFDAAVRELDEAAKRLEEEKRKVSYSTHFCTLDLKSYNWCRICYEDVDKSDYFYHCCFCDDDRYALCRPCWLDAPYGNECRDRDHPRMKLKLAAL